MAYEVGGRDAYIKSIASVNAALSIEGSPCAKYLLALGDAHASEK